MNFIRLVLVDPKYARNVGMVSRAMANYGVERLILLHPRCELGLEAHEGAAEGQRPLRNQVTYSTWQDFLQNEEDGIRLAFSRRKRQRYPSEPLTQALNALPLTPNRPIYLIFGSEDQGLSLEDLQHTHRQIFLELDGPVQSMNLSHAVVASLQICRDYFAQQKLSTNEAPHSDNSPSNEHPHGNPWAPSYDPEPLLREWLEELGLDVSSQKKWNALVATKQLLQRAAPDNEEWQRFANLIQQTLTRLRQRQNQKF